MGWPRCLWPCALFSCRWHRYDEIACWETAMSLIPRNNLTFLAQSTLPHIWWQRCGLRTTVDLRNPQQAIDVNSFRINLQHNDGAFACASGRLPTLQYPCEPGAEAVAAVPVGLTWLVALTGGLAWRMCWPCGTARGRYCRHDRSPRDMRAPLAHVGSD